MLVKGATGGNVYKDLRHGDSGYILIEMFVYLYYVSLFVCFSLVFFLSQVYGTMHNEHIIRRFDTDTTTKRIII